MTRRKVAGAPPPEKPAEVARLESLLAYHVGALHEIRREVRQMHGGWRARVKQVLLTMLGPDEAEKERDPCP